MQVAGKVNGGECCSKRIVIQSALSDKSELELIKLAADMNGASLSGFVRMAAIEVSKRVVERSERGEF